MTGKLSEMLAILETYEPVSANGANINMTGVNMANFDRVMFILQTGVLGTNATVDFRLQQSTAVGGTYANISGKSITQLTQAGTDDNKQVVIEIKSDELDVSNAKMFVRGQIDVGTAASLVSAIVLGQPTRFEPASTFNQAAVDEIVA